MALSNIRDVAELAARAQCGTRVRYMGGCRCDACRRANSDYEKMRIHARENGDWNGIVPAGKARRHLQRLQRQGVGTRMVAASADVPRSIVSGILAGRRRNARARTVRKILAVSAAQCGDAALIDAGPTWRLIDELLEEGFTKKRLATELGYRTRALQIGRERVTVRTAARIRALYDRLMF